MIIVSNTFDENWHQNFQHQSFVWHYDECDLSEHILFSFVMCIYTNVEGSVSFRGLFNGPFSLQVQVGCRNSISPKWVSEKHLYFISWLTYVFIKTRQIYYRLNLLFKVKRRNALQFYLTTNIVPVCNINTPLVSFHCFICQIKALKFLCESLLTFLVSN